MAKKKKSNLADLNKLDAKYNKGEHSPKLEETNVLLSKLMENEENRKILSKFL